MKRSNWKGIRQFFCAVLLTVLALCLTAQTASAWILFDTRYVVNWYDSDGALLENAQLDGDEPAYPNDTSALGFLVDGVSAYFGYWKQTRHDQENRDNYEWHYIDYRAVYISDLCLSGTHYGGTATCTEKARCEICGQEYGRPNPNNHAWVLDTAKGDGGWEWADDFSSAKAYLKCTRESNGALCGETADVTDDSPVPGAKFYDVASGKVTFTVTAAVSKDGKSFTGEKTIAEDPLPGKTFITWVVETEGSTTVELDEPYTGNETYPKSVPESINCHYEMDFWDAPEITTKVRVENGEFYQDTYYTKTMVFKPLKPWFIQVPAAEASCTAPANSVYWKCQICGLVYSDAKGQVGAKLEDFQIGNALGHLPEHVAAQGPTCTDYGVKEHYRCTREGCGKLFTDEETQNPTTKFRLRSDPPLGHQWALDTAQGDNGWSWAADYSTATANLACTRVIDGAVCGKTATATDNAPVKGQWVYNENTKKVEIPWTAAAAKDGASFTGETTQHVDIARELTYICWRIEGVGETWQLLDGDYTGSEPFPGSAPARMNCHFALTGWSDPERTESVSERAGGFVRTVVYTRAAIYDTAVLTHVDEAAPTCAAEGAEAYWTCENCQKKFSDENGANEIDAPAPIPIDKDAHPQDRIVTDPAVPPTCVDAGLTEGSHCDACGAVLVEQEEDPATGEHHYGVWKRTVTRTYYRCPGCGDGYWVSNPGSRNPLPGLVRNAAGEPVDYTARVAREGGVRILRVIPVLPEGLTEERSLYLKPEDAEAWRGEGIAAIVLDCGDAAILTLDLAALSADWFPTEGTADYFVFALTPADGGAQARAEALAGETRVPAAALSGVVLRTADGEEALTANGL